jgi:hypothetical protein
VACCIAQSRGPRLYAYGANFAGESEWHPSILPLLDTPKVIHIWYTTVTICGWLSLELNEFEARCRIYEKGNTFDAAQLTLC